MLKTLACNHAHELKLASALGAQHAKRVREIHCADRGCLGRDPLWPRPTLATTYFDHGLTDVGHGQFGAFSRVRGEGEEGEGVWGSQPREGVGVRWVVGPKFRFFPSPATIFFFLSLGIFLCLRCSLRVFSCLFSSHWRFLR